MRALGLKGPGFSLAEGGIVIDLSLTRVVRLYPELRTVRAQGGALLGDLDRAR